MTAPSSFAMLMGIASFAQSAFGMPGDTTLVSEADPNVLSVAASGTIGPFAISSDGRYVAFYSYALNLVAGDTNGRSNVFVRDRQTNTTTLVSVGSSGTLGNGDSVNPAISADGRYVVFYSNASNLVADDTNASSDVFVRDLQTNTTTRVSVDSSGVQGNSASYGPAISADGRYVVFVRVEPGGRDPRARRHSP
ncbi:MAG TPA: hypothetical protein VMT89_13365 [Candidatus Acidoferrales bacterium]|nr:hypothetical protein [Candidatus Acidoferrales bacterium]